MDNFRFHLNLLPIGRSNHKPKIDRSDLGQSKTDEKIMELLGSPATIEAGYRLLLRTYREKIYWVVRRSVIIHDDADDITQEVFLRVWKGVHRFRGESALFTWLYRICINEVLRFLNQRRLKVMVPWNDTVDRMAHALTSEGGFNGTESERRLIQAISTLPPRQQMVFNLRYYEEMPYEEMAELLGVSEGALKASYHHDFNKVTYIIKKG